MEQCRERRGAIVVPEGLVIDAQAPRRGGAARFFGTFFELTGDEELLMKSERGGGPTLAGVGRGGTRRGSFASVGRVEIWMM